MLKNKVENREERFLRKFQGARRIEKLSDDKEIKTFEEFQRFNLIRAGAAGKFRITKQGQDALGMGVRKYLGHMKEEKRLFKEYLSAKMQHRWFVMLSGLIILLCLTLYMFIDL